MRRRYPQIRTLSALRRDINSMQTSTLADVVVDSTGGRKRCWVPARGEGFPSLEGRLRAAWLVFSGQADAVTWPEDDGYWIAKESQS